MKQRIGYIDAIRGFTMLLVVYSHVLFFTFDYDFNWSINNIFLTFRMPLFFFLSGFLMYKKGLFVNVDSLGNFLRKKARVQLIPTLVFSLLYAAIIPVSYRWLLLDKAKCGYWFTYTLFFYFLIYAVGDILIGKYTKQKKGGGRTKIVTGAIVAILIYAFSKFSLSPACPWYNSWINGVIGLANFQFFIFFYFGALVRAYFDIAERLLEKDAVRTGIIVGFILFQLVLHIPMSKEWIISSASYSIYSLIRSLSGFWGIAAVFLLFRSSGPSVLGSRGGRFLQYIGERTLDVYLIHLILINTDMRFIGDFLETHNSIVLELAFGGIVSLGIIGLCLLISRVIRCSDTLAKLLFGKIIKG